MKRSAIPATYGIILSIALIVYFFILSMFGLHTYVWFSLANGIMTGIGIFMAIRDFKKAKIKKFKYQKGFMVGLKTGFYATVIFTFFFAIYASNINPGFTDNLLKQYGVEYETGFGLIIFIVFLMGIVTTFILTLACMQLFKDSWNTHKPHESSQQEKYPTDLT